MRNDACANSPQLQKRAIHITISRTASFLLMTVMSLVASVFITGCGHPPDSDVTSSPEYNFSLFTGTVWKTKIELGLVDLKHYTGEQIVYLDAPKHFDTNDAEYTPGSVTKVIAVIPVGTQLQIDRLLKDNGMSGQLRITATLKSGAYAGKSVFLDNLLLAKNCYIWADWSSSTNWGVNPDMLEK